jgi:hypothetical protein
MYSGGRIVQHLRHDFDSHAGRVQRPRRPDDLVQWFVSMTAARPELILAHGEDRARRALVQRIETEQGIGARCPIEV